MGRGGGDAWGFFPVWTVTAAVPCNPLNRGTNPLQRKEDVGSRWGVEASYSGSQGFVAATVQRLSLSLRSGDLLALVTSVEVQQRADPGREVALGHLHGAGLGTGGKAQLGCGRSPSMTSSWVSMAFAVVSMALRRVQGHSKAFYGC